MMTVKVRRVQYYHPYGGTWYRTQVKFLFFWWTSPIVYTSKALSEQSMRYIEDLFNKPTKKVVYEAFKKWK